MLCHPNLTISVIVRYYVEHVCCAAQLPLSLCDSTILELGRLLRTDLHALSGLGNGLDLRSNGVGSRSMRNITIDLQWAVRSEPVRQAAW